MTVDSIWVTACGVNPPAASVQVGTKKLVGDEFNVTLNSTAATVVYDPRGITTQFQTTTIRVIGPNYSDSVMINEVGRVSNNEDHQEQQGFHDHRDSSSRSSC